MELSEKLMKLLPPLAVVGKWLDECRTELFVISKAYAVVFGDSNRIDSHAATDVLIAVQAQRDRLWEVINTGRYADVRKIHRQAYTIVTALEVLLKCMQSNNHTATSSASVRDGIRQLDYGLLLGYPLNEPHDKLLTEYMTELQKFLVPLDVAAELPKNSFESDSMRRDNEQCQIAILQSPSIETFQSAYFSKRRPALITNCMSQWPAMTQWSQPTYLTNVAGERMVPIEIGSHYTNDDWAQDMVQLKDFIRRQFIDEAADGEKQTIEYLAQHNLFDQIPQLRQDIHTPEYCCVSEQDSELEVDTKIWLGPKGTISPMHHDPKHNLLCQVFGHKRIILAAPEDSCNLYPHQGDMLSNTSLIDAEHVDLEEFPLAGKVKFYHLTLYKGEMLYIPPKWWHYVRSLEKSLSVSFWWE